jgi:hypothetical protein
MNEPDDWERTWRDDESVRAALAIQRPEPDTRVAVDEVPTGSLPRIESVTSKLGTAERRLEFLENKLARPGSYASTSSANYDRAEISMLRAAISLFKYAQRRAQER